MNTTKERFRHLCKTELQTSLSDSKCSCIPSKVAPHVLSAEERRLLELLPGPLVTAGAGGTILYANLSACTMLGYDHPQELTGKTLQRLMPERFRDKHQTGFSRYRRTGRSHLLGKRVRVVALTKNGDEVAIELCIRMFRRSDGTDLIIGAFALADSSEDYIDLSVSAMEDHLEQRAYTLV